MKKFGHDKSRPPQVGARLLDLHALRARGIFYHPNHLRKLWEDNKFPRPFNLSPRRIAWSEKEIDEWIEAKLKAREVEPVT